MSAQYEIRADFDQDTIVVYQAYAPVIADAALRAARFVAPFSFQRTTWIKPSLRWLMHRGDWARKPGQESVLAVRITRAGWEEALSRSVADLTPQIRKAAALVKAGRVARAQRLLPAERVYPLPEKLENRLCRNG